MKISDLKGRLANILEVPEDPIKLGKELWKWEDFSKGESPKMLRILVRAFALECIWEEFEVTLEKEGKGLSNEVTYEEIKLLIPLITRFFSGFRTSQKRREEVKEERRAFLEAVEISKRDIFH